MASDPRLNLFNFAGTLLNQNSAIFGVAHATGCPSVLNRQRTASQNAFQAAGQTLGVVGAFANLAAGVGGGTVGAGLNVLAGISDAVRIGGTSQLPQAAIGNGQSYVLKTVGIDSNQLNTAGQFNPSVANNALNAASQVYNSVSQGKFSAQDIPAAFSAFQNGTALISSLFAGATPATQPQNSQFGQTCGVGNYATDLIRFAPKYKFLFVVQFEFDPAFNDILTQIDPAFVIKSTTRPTVDFEYEDVNMYNFRTKVAKKATYQPITMKFLDDDRNMAFQFYTTYLKLLSPIANIDAELQKVDPLQAYDLAGGGMGFESGTSVINPSYNSVGQYYAGSIGTFGNSASNAGPETRNILRRITIFHVYKQGRMMNVMHFYNPKITKMELDELDMASSDGAEVGLTFSYDNLFIIPGYQIFGSQSPIGYNLNAITNKGLFPLGVDPSTSGDFGDTRDGFGLAYGQSILIADQANPSTLNLSTPSTTSLTASGSNLTGIASIAPTVGGGGSGTILDQNGNNQPTSSVQTQSNSAIDPSVAQTTDPSASTSPTSSVQDPVNGTTPASADNSQNVTNVQTAYSTQVAAINQTADAQIAAIKAAAEPNLPDPGLIASIEQGRRQQLWNAQGTNTGTPTTAATTSNNQNPLGQ